MKSNGVRDFYEKDSSVYDERWRSPGGLKTDARQKKIIHKLCGNWEEKIILEIGCGTGRFSLELLKYSSTVMFVDLSFEMIKIARNHKSLNNQDFSSASIYNLPFPDNYFDRILSVNVFNHLDKPVLALSEINRVLKKDGQVVVNFANYCSYFFPIAIFITHQESSLYKEVYSAWRNPHQINDFFEMTDFNIMDVIGNVHVPKGLDVFLIRDIILLLDRISRYSFLNLLSPILFYRAQKK